MQLRWAYPKGPVAGAWGPSTSNLNFCEEVLTMRNIVLDFLITPYIGEFVNTLTNIIYIVYGTLGLRRVGPRPDGGLLSTLAFPYWSLIGVGVLSGWFHATLKYHSQMGDELSMLLAVGAVQHQLLCFDARPSDRIKYTFYVLGSLIPVSVYHVWADEIYVHEALIKRQVKSDESKKKLGHLVTFGISCGLFGYFLWLIDFNFCPYVTALKRSLGLPWAFFLELHGWWHIFTGICAYAGMGLADYLVTIQPGHTGTGPVEEGFVWPVRAVLRDVHASKASDADKAL
ncbi:hypothetical protein ACEQ8H_007407 [Pleosporales sp. CAS-2024a]